jgi:hypothetical protein
MEVNFWVKPKTPPALSPTPGLHTERTIFSLFGKLDYTLIYDDNNPTEYELRAYFGNRLGLIDIDYTVQSTTVDVDEWWNFNVMLKFAFFVDSNIWQGVDYT